MSMLRFVVLCAFLAIHQQGWAQQLEAYTPLEQEKWMQEEQPLKFRVLGGITYDSNLFRLSDDTDAQSVLGTSEKSDIIFRLGAGGKYELRKSRQKFIAEINVSEYKFKEFDDLDNTSNDLRGEWQWELGNNWNGELGLAHRRYLESFSNFQLYLRDMVDQDRLYGSANYLLNSRLKFTLDADRYDTEHSEQTRNVLDSTINNMAFTVNWVTPAQNTIGLKYRTADASYPNRDTIGTLSVDNSYKEDELSVVTQWAVTGASQIYARLGYTKRNFDELPTRNFSDPTWRLTYLWRPTGKAGLEVATWREISEFQDLSANYVRVTGLSVVPTWSLTPQLALRGRIAYETRDYVGDPGLGAVVVAREDKDTVFQISALWTPLRLTELIMTLETGKRTSNQMFADYDYNAISVLATRYF
ncbi:MAG: outer membrane beta-barrel protein [Prolixibacteraceae bacterium]|nr:outer membrane beta-barrel protein [Burkholderiales bacterium]